MSKIKTTFFCQNCGTQHAKWQGQCSACKEWNTLVEEVIQKTAPKSWDSSLPDENSLSRKRAPQPQRISEI
ncbi:MAG: DNA repair protein RadA, partial [Nonlabens sp.]|nr:DNA repair protein RadA [Nonlabens sp.]